MSQLFAVRSLPDAPSLDFLKDQAKRLLKQIRAGNPEALALVAALHPAFRGTPPTPEHVALHDAQLVVARQHGCPTWSALKHEIEQRLARALPWEERLAQAVWRGRLEDLQILLAEGRPLGAAGRALLAPALAGIADRSVWHRPVYREIAQALIEVGVDCPIWPAARLGLREQVERCLEADPALLTALDDQGRTPLQRAALIYGSDKNCEALVEWLIARGAPIDIHTASAFSMVDVVGAELKRDPALVHAYCQGSTPLNWAVRPRREIPDNGVQHADAVVCEMLLAAGADPETPDTQENGMRPLHHLGEWCGTRASVDVLLAHGADLQARDDAGWTPLDYAISRNREPMIEYYRSLGGEETRTNWPNTWGELSEAMMGAARRNDVALVKSLLERDPSLATMRSHNGETPVHPAAHDGHYEVVELLIRAGADLTAQEDHHWGGTALHWAAERQPVIVALLLDHGADVNSRNVRTGQTPLHYCARCDDVPEVAELLLARGADPAIRDNRGNLALDFAERRAGSKVAEVLRPVSPSPSTGR